MANDVAVRVSTDTKAELCRIRQERFLRYTEGRLKVPGMPDAGESLGMVVDELIRQYRDHQRRARKSNRRIIAARRARLADKREADHG